MKCLFKALLPLTLLALTSNCLKFAILSDVHVAPFYDPNLDDTTFCQSHFSTPGKQPTKGVFSPLGRINCDPPAALLENFLKRIN